jgi:iron complex outermembrane receptor protein
VGAYFLQDEEYRFEDGIGCAQGNNCGRIKPRAESHRISISNTETTSYAAFGELSFDFSDRLSLTVGGRYTDDTRDYTYAVDGWGRAGALANIGLVSEGTGPGGTDLGQPERDCNNPANRYLDADGQTLCGTVAAPMGFDPVDVSSGWDNFSGKISLSYAVSDNTNLYALYSEGFKGGGFQHDARNVVDVMTRLVDSETAENYEIGWKGSFDRARFALTWFQMEQINAQNNALIPVGGADGATTTVVTNFGGIENDGIEFEGTVLLADGFTLGGSVALYNGILGPGSVISASEDEFGNLTGEDVSGQRPSASPEETWVIYGEYDFVLGNGSSITLRADVQHRDGIWRRLPDRDRTLVSDPSVPRYLTDDLDNLGVRLSWMSASGGTTVSLWGRNLNGDLDYKSIGPASGNFNQTASARAKIGRKQVGLDASFSF